MTGRVLFVTGEYPPMRGGVGDYTARLVEALGAAGWDARVLTATAAASADPRVLARVGRWDWSLARRVAEAAAEAGAQVVHIQYQTGAFAMHPAVNLLPRLLRRRARLPVVTTFHDLLEPYLFPKAGRLRRWANRTLAGASAAVVATNAADRERMVERFGRAGLRATVIPIGSNLPDLAGIDRAAVRRELGIAAGECAVGFFGFLTRDKGADLLLDALGRLPAPRPRLVVVGGDLGDTDLANAAYHAELRRRLAEAPFPVTVTGYLPPERAAAALAALDLLVFPFRDGASLRSGTLLAGTRSGTAVLTTDPAAPDALAPLVAGESLWVVPAGDPVALADGVRLLLAKPDLRARLAREARGVSRAFDWGEIAARHIALYEDLLARREGRDGTH